MNRREKRARAVPVATAAAVVLTLTAGLTTPAAAGPHTDDGTTTPTATTQAATGSATAAATATATAIDAASATATAIDAASATATAADAASGSDAATGSGRATARGGDGTPATRRVTLVTGDRVVVGADGRVKRFEPAEGRARIPVSTRTTGGRTTVVPADAQPLLADGTLDRRLFDLDALVEAADAADRADRLQVIVGYRGAARQARAEVRAADGTALRRSLRTANADALTAPDGDPGLWNALTDGRDTGRSAAAGIARVWLDGVRRTSLDRSTAQIGAPGAWSTGLTGKGVTVAVLDTGVHATHPDLKDRLVAEKNFSTSPVVADRNGHGTHVASTAVGTGGRPVSGRVFKGVAPGADLLSGKVLDDRGQGTDSGILAGIDWAVEQGADVVNLSLGGGDTPGTDPLEAQIDRLSEERNVLFVVAAGNGGTSGVDSPGSARAALTVGAVDRQDRIADFSGVNKVPDAVKPDVTAPGVGIVAAAVPGAAGQQPTGYVGNSGTSMATPHVAGLAALLRERHPDWTAARIKAVVTASAEGTAHSPFEQGAGRVRADRAVTQTVITEPGSLAFPPAAWPHTDDASATRRITYRNLGGQDVTLDLALATRDPRGRTAPAGFFALDARQVTVPANGTASVRLTADTRPGGTVHGVYGAYVTATGGGQTVRTAAAVEREAEAYDVTVRTIGRPGSPAPLHYGTFEEVGGSDGESRTVEFQNPTGTTTVRLPKGRYSLRNLLITQSGPGAGTDVIVQPQLDLDRTTTLTVDARTAKPVDITVPDRGAKQFSAGLSVAFGDSGAPGTELDWLLGWGWEDFRTAHMGPAATAYPVRHQWDTWWEKGARTRYAAVDVGEPGTRFATGRTKRYRAGDFSTVKVAVGSPVPGKQAHLLTEHSSPETLSDIAVGEDLKPPTTRTFLLSTPHRLRWTFQVGQFEKRDEDGFPIEEATQSLGEPQRFVGGRVYSKKFNVGVFGPRLRGTEGIQRYQDRIYTEVPLFADGPGHRGYSRLTSARTTLYRGSTKVAETPDSLESATLKVPSGPAADYRLTSSAVRSGRVSGVSTRIDTSFTFRGGRSSDLVELPFSTARFGARLGPDSTAPAGRVQSVPVTVQGAAAGRQLKSLKVSASYDQGRTWKKLTVRGGEVSVRNPAAGKGVALRAVITDRAGNTSTLTIRNAYLGK
ncbi:S8 family peptidase [Streptomyces sp. JNUCC 64]